MFIEKCALKTQTVVLVVALTYPVEYTDCQWCWINIADKTRLSGYNKTSKCFKYAPVLIIISNVSVFEPTQNLTKYTKNYHINYTTKLMTLEIVWQFGVLKSVIRELFIYPFIRRMNSWAISHSSEKTWEKEQKKSHQRPSGYSIY